jgi:type IV secretion system protein VirB4
MQELLPWIDFVTPSLILQKDGSLLAGFEVKGLDLDAATDEASKYLTEQVEHAYRSFDGRITVWWAVDRVRYPRFPTASEFDNPVAAEVDRLHAAPFESGYYFVNRNYLFVLFTQDTGVDNFFERFNYYLHHESMPMMKAYLEAAKDALSGKRMFNVEKSQIGAMCMQAEEAIGSFEAACPDLVLRRLEMDEFSGALFRMVNPGAIDTPRKPFDHPLDGWLGAGSMRVGFELLEFQGSQERRFVAVFGLKDWPPSTYPHLFQTLASLNAEVVISQVFKFLNDGGRRALEQTRRYYVLTQVGMLKAAIAKLTGAEARAEAGHEDLIAEVDAALARLNTEGLRYGYHTINIVVRGRTRDEVEAAASDIARELNGRQFVPVRERLNLLSAWQATLPGCWNAITRYSTNSVENLADCSPLYTIPLGDTKNEHLSTVLQRPMPALTTFVSRYGTPVAVNAQTGQNGHLMTIGPTRTGKTTLMNFLLSQAQKYEPNTIVFDRDRSCRITSILHGGSHVDLGTEGSVRFNPFSVLIDDKPDDVLWLRQWLSRLISGDGYKVTDEDRREIDDVLGMLRRANPEEANMSRFHGLLQSPVLRNKFFEWVQGQPLGHVFDHTEDEFNLSRWTCFETKEFLKYEALTGPFLDYAFHQIYRRLDGTPTIIYLEEAWALLANPLFLVMLNDWLRTFAKKNARIWMATQSVSEIKSSPVFTALVESCPNKLFLANPGLRDSETMRNVYSEVFALPDNLIQQIGTLTPRVEYLMTGPDSHRVFQARFAPEILGYLRSESHVQKIFDKHRDSGEPDWVERYLRESMRSF